MSSVFIILIPLLPLVAFLANGLFGRWLKRGGGWLAVGCMGGSALISTMLFIGALTHSIELPLDVTLWSWMDVGSLNLSIGFHVDPLTVLMLFFVTFVSTLVFLYSMGYMKGDPGFNRFFAYLGLFDFSMLVLVLGDSLPVLFIGWEGVGLCSYLLIGYYLSLPGAPSAGMKAFVVNRIGDFGFLVAMFMIFYALGTLNITELIQGALAANADATHPAHELLKYGAPFVTALTLMLFLGCTGKSAQIPLFVWLPDAMAGPTPVSALIHAATMVTAGVYLVVRLSAIFALAPVTMLVIAIVAALTAFVAGSIALTQQDIKKVLAYSTVSQLGYMFLACGMGAFTAGIFHVFTHAFFKACLFLGAGSVIHSAHHVQDLELMGGLRKKMPKTAITFLIACLSIAGIAPLAGFISKDEILWKTFSGGHVWLWVIGIVTALMTAFYSFRAYFMTFEGKSRLPEDVEPHVHESPWTMTVPLIVLAAGAILAGLLNLPELILGHGNHGMITNFLDPVVADARMIMAANIPATHAAHGAALEWGLMGFSVCVALLGIAMAWWMCLKKWPTLTTKLALRPLVGSLFSLSFNRWWWDDCYNKVFVAGTEAAGRLSTWIDLYIIDGLLHLVGWLAASFSRLMRFMQSGQVQAYALAILIGVNVLVFLALWL